MTKWVSLPPGAPLSGHESIWDPYVPRDARELAAAKASGSPTAPCVCCGAEGVIGYAGKGRAGCEPCITGRCPKGNVRHADW